MNDSVSGKNFNDFLEYFSQVSTCGNVILDVEDKALESSFLSMFNRRNHAEFVAVLAQQIKDLQFIASDIRKSGMDVSKADALNRFILELIGLATALSTVCEGLHGKTFNRPYSYAKYKADVEAVRAKKASCNLAQTRLFE